jgi:hypothetical protein
VPESRNQAIGGTRPRIINFDMILLVFGRFQRGWVPESRNQAIGGTRLRIIDFDMILKGF